MKAIMLSENEINAINTYIDALSSDMPDLRRPMGVYLHPYYIAKKDEYRCTVVAVCSIFSGVEEVVARNAMKDSLEKSDNLHWEFCEADWDDYCSFAKMNSYNQVLRKELVSSYILDDKHNKLTEYQQIFSQNIEPYENTVPVANVHRLYNRSKEKTLIKK